MVDKSLPIIVALQYKVYYLIVLMEIELSIDVSKSSAAKWQDVDVIVVVPV